MAINNIILPLNLAFSLSLVRRYKAGIIANGPVKRIKIYENNIRELYSSSE